MFQRKRVIIDVIIQFVSRIFQGKDIDTSQVQEIKSGGKDRKTITTKTFTKGLMDVSLLTSNATQLRSLLLDPNHTFYHLCLYLLVISIGLQICSTILMLISDFLKSTNTGKAQSRHELRKALQFMSVAVVSFVTMSNVLISVFLTPTDVRHHVPPSPS